MNDAIFSMQPMPRLACAVVFVAALLVLQTPAGAADAFDPFHKAIQKASPGTTIEVPDGTCRAKSIKSIRGTADAPIVLRAAHRGKAVMDGAAGFVIRDCAFLIVEGFVFIHDADQQAVKLDNCRNVRVTRNTFRLKERAKPRHWEHWVTIDGARSEQNRIDHNLFERKANRGSHVFVRGDDDALVCSQRDRVDHNHFRDFVFANGDNGHETIRTGGNDLGASGRSSFTTIEDNLLERCSGENEIMSLKSSDNVVRNNTLVNCRGAICLRLGNRSVVSGNFIIASDTGPGFGGVKVYGYEHRVFNNYFAGLTGRRHEGPLALLPGTLDTPTTENIGEKYDDLTSVPATRCWLAFNTWVDCSPLEFGFAKEDKDKQRAYSPQACVFVNNLVARTRPNPKPLVNLGVVRNLKAYGNLAYAEGKVPDASWASWFRWTDPQLRRGGDDDGLWRLTASSPAIDAAAEDSVAVDDDVFGRLRSGRRDVGAEEFGQQESVRRPLKPEDVGPSAP